MISDPSTNVAFLAGGGAMGERIRAYPWANTPLGEPQFWPQGLRTSVRVLLTTQHPIFIFWGHRHTCLYNDAYSRSLGPEKHPSILGAPGRESWEEIWPIIGPQIEQVMRGEGATWHENQLVPIIRHGALQDVYWTYSYSPIDEPEFPHGVGGVLVICTETTELVLHADAKAQLQREELAHLSRVATLSVLSGSLAHELSQPLSSIIINAQAGQLCMSQDAPDPVELRAIFADIVSAECRAAEIIERLRAMLRRGQVALQPVSVDDSLEELLRLTRSDLIARGVSVSNLTTGDLPPAMTDRVQLQQVLLNLIVNACDAMESNPPEDRILTLTTFIAQDEIHIGVLDRGVGLPDDVETLFQPFHSTKEGGLGMGLSICRALVTSHGGRLWAERRADRGAAFYLALPLVKDLPRRER